MLSSKGYAETHILMLGDSLTEGYGVEKAQSYPSLIESKLRKKGYIVKITNGGISGSTSASSLSRMKWYLKSKPDILVLALGANDGLRGLSVDNMKKNLGKTIELAKENGMMILLAGMKALPNYGIFYSKKFEKAYEDLADEHGIPLIPFLLEGVAGQPKFNLSDMIHPNPAGYKVISETVIQYLEPLLKR